MLLPMKLLRKLHIFFCIIVDGAIETTRSNKANKFNGEKYCFYNVKLPVES